MEVSVYDKPENTNITDEEVKKSCALGMIPYREIPSFTNRERYLCRTAQEFYDIASKNADELEELLYSVLIHFCISDDGILTANGSDAAKRAFEYFGVKEEDEENMLATREMIENWEW